MFASGDLETVELVAPPERDPFGDPVPGTGGRLTVPGCLFAPGPSAENLNGANQVQADGTLYMPAGSPLPGPHHTVRVRDRDYEVIGEPRVWGSAGVEVVLQTSTG